MSRIISVRVNPNAEHFDDIVSQVTQVGFQKSIEISQFAPPNAPIFVKKSVNVISPCSEATQCRICLQNELESNQKLIQPCQCTGSVQSVHQKCFTEWISRSLSTKSNRQLAKIGKEGIECDLCKMKFEVKLSFEKICINLEKLKQTVKRRKCQFFTLLSMLLMTLILFVATLILLPKQPFNINLNKKEDMQRKGMKDSWLKVALLGSMGVELLIMVFLSYLLISEYGFTYRTEFGYKGKKQAKTAKGIVME